MGIGRFAFTPLLPVVLHDGVVDLAGASGLAASALLTGPLLYGGLAWRLPVAPRICAAVQRGRPRFGDHPTTQPKETA